MATEFDITYETTGWEVWRFSIPESVDADKVRADPSCFMDYAVLIDSGVDMMNEVLVEDVEGS